MFLGNDGASLFYDKFGFKPVSLRKQSNVWQVPSIGNKPMEIKVRHAEIDDYEDFHEVYSHPKTTEGTLQIPFPSKEQWRARLTDKPNELIVLVAEVDRKVVGSIALHIHSNSPRRRHAANFGMAVRDDLQGKGVGSKLLQSILDLCDNWLNLHRVELEGIYGQS